METKQELEQTAPASLRISKVISWLFYAWAIFGIFMLVLRIFLLVAAANVGNSFSAFVMNVSSQYLHPFWGIFPEQQLSNTSTLDVSALFAIVVYLFLAWGLKELVNYIQQKIDDNVESRQQEALQKQLADNDITADDVVQAVVKMKQQRTATPRSRRSGQ